MSNNTNMELPSLNQSDLTRTGQVTDSSTGLAQSPSTNPAQNGIQVQQPLNSTLIQFQSSTQASLTLEQHTSSSSPPTIPPSFPAWMQSIAWSQAGFSINATFSALPFANDPSQQQPIPPLPQQQQPPSSITSLFPAALINLLTPPSLLTLRSQGDINNNSSSSTSSSRLFQHQHLWLSFPKINPKVYHQHRLDTISLPNVMSTLR